ncbi:hypothetical protein P3X46_021429 [Hevea brasiliensis]|uniref:Uncharacterized protein n=1 Tax=Hevea brasiliensis TaxID=3981 RepID=A0ABQ9LHM4_HEVBR|nr:hypothetical protein P3X46_021429 [Hevea brasiliensis]
MKLKPKAAANHKKGLKFYFMEMLMPNTKPTESEFGEVSRRMEAVKAITEPRFNKKNASLIPKKRSSVKKMIFLVLFSSVSSLLCKHTPASPSPSPIKSRNPVSVSVPLLLVPFRIVELIPTPGIVFYCLF